jgi:hypothetical protein
VNDAIQQHRVKGKRRDDYLFDSRWKKNEEVCMAGGPHPLFGEL